MHKFSLAKIFFCLAVFCFVAKPFLGFSLFSRLHPPAVENIFVKAFTKRKVEQSEDSNYSMSAIQKKLANPAESLLLPFSFFLSILFPAVLAVEISTTNRFLRRIKPGLSQGRPTWLLNGKLII
jgi:hypothetical protein